MAEVKCGTIDNCGSCPIFEAGHRERRIVGTDMPVKAAEKLGLIVDGYNDGTTPDPTEEVVSSLEGYVLGGSVELFEVAVKRKTNGECQVS